MLTKPSLSSRFRSIPARYRWAGAAVLLIGCVLVTWVALVAWQHRELLLGWVHLARDFTADWLRGAGIIWFFLGLALGPLFFLPVSIFYLTAGVYGYAWAIPVVWAALAVNIALAYWVASGVFHPVIERIVSRFGYRIPQVRDGEALNITLIVRIAPALPFCIQSYLLGLARVRFRTYMIVSWTFQALISVGMIMLGDSLFRGGAGLALLGISVIVIVSLGIKILRDRYGISSGENGASL